MKSSTVLKFFILVKTASIFGCATEPFPYYDSAQNDHNRAPIFIEKNMGQESPQSKADYLFLTAEMSALEGNNQLAIEKLKAAYEFDKTSSVILHRLASEYYRQNRIDEALLWLEKGLVLKPNQKELNILAAGLYTVKKDYAKSEAIYKKLMKNDKDDPEPILYFAALNAEQKKFKAAITAFDRLVNFKDYDQKYLAYYYRARTKFESDRIKYGKEIRNDLTQCLSEKSDYLEAIQFLGQLIEKAEGKKKVFEFYARHQKKHGPITRLADVLSQYYLELGDYDNAFEQLEIIENTTQDPIQVKLKLALILIDKKLYDRARVKLEELNILVPESDKVKFYLGSIYQELKKNELAVKTYLEIQNPSKHYEDAVKSAAYILKDNGQVEKARTLLSRLVRDMPNTVQNYIAYAQFLEENRNYDEGVSLLKKAEGKFNQSAEVQFYLGMLYDKKHDKENMFVHMHKAIALDPKHVQALNYVAYSMVELKQDFSVAEKFAERAYALDSNDPYIVDTLGWIHFLKADYPKALSFLRRAHDTVPHVPVIADHLGDTYVKLNRFDKAYEVYQKARDNETDLEKVKQISIKISVIKNQDGNERRPASMPLDPKAKPISDSKKGAR